MKSRIIASLIYLLFVSALQSQSVENVQRTLLTKRTASWCPNCGTWGWDFFHNLQEDNPDKAVFIAAHYDGALMTKTGLDITNNFGGTYQPVFFLNHNDVGATPFNTSSLRTSIKTQVNSNFTSTPVANSGILASWDGKAIKVNAKVKFFRATSGEFYLGVYLLEDNVIAYQSGVGDNAKHMKLLRNSFTESSWGTQVINGSVAVNQEFTNNFSLTTGNPTGKAFEIASIIWKKNGTKYEVVNVWTTKTITLATNSAEISQVTEMTVFPVSVGSIAKVKLHSVATLSNASLDLLDIQGSKVAVLHQGELAQGEHHFVLERPNSIAAGLYFLQLRTGNRSITRRVIFN